MLPLAPSAVVLLSALGSLLLYLLVHPGSLVFLLLLSNRVRREEESTIVEIGPLVLFHDPVFFLLRVEASQNLLQRNSPLFDHWWEHGLLKEGGVVLWIKEFSTVY